MTDPRLERLRSYFRVSRREACAHPGASGWVRLRLACRRCRYAYSKRFATHYGQRCDAELPAEAEIVLLEHVLSHPENR